MEGGQKINIPLDSGLDVHSSDMLVNVQQPKFQHNRQKYQGKYLPTSMRFEHDGWAAGNDVYQFKVNEATVEAGSYIVTKSYVNGNPTYKLSVRDKDMYIVSSVFYNNKSSIKGSSVSDTDVATGVNPDISGSINGKPFLLEYNSVDGTVHKKDGHDDIILVSSVQNSDYSIEIKLQDKASQIHIAFAGLDIPDDIYNGDYLLGSFSLYKNFGKANAPDYRTLWADSQFNCYYNGSQFWIEDANGNRMTDYYAVVPSDNGYVSLSFVVPLVFYDNIVIYTQDIVPFFSGITCSNSSKVVNTQSSESYYINKWSLSMYDPENTTPVISDKLYRNLPAYSGASDRNRQLLDQAVPMWFGINVYCDWLDTTGLSVTKPSGTVLASQSWDYDVDHFFGYNDEHTYYQHVWIKCTDAIQKYNGVVHKCHFTMWEHTVDATDKAVLSYHNNSRKVSFVYSIFEDYSYTVTDPYTGDHDVSHREHITNKRIDVYIDSTYSYLDWDSMQDMFYSACDSRTDIELSYIMIDDVVVMSNDSDHPKIRQVQEWQAATLNISGSKFWKSGTITVIFNSVKGCILQLDSLSLKGQLSSLGPKMSYNRQNVNNAITEWLYATGHARFVACCMAHVLSELFIKSENLLTTTLDKSAFQVNEIVHNDPNTLYYSELFKHKLNNAYMSQGNLSIIVNLCAKENNTYLFYTDNRSTDIAVSVCPGHILYNDIKKITDYEAGNISALPIAKSYIGVIDIEYGLAINISAAAAQTARDTLFNYIQTADNIYTGELLSGNKFTNEYADQLQSDIRWDFSALPKFKVVLNPASSKDIDQIQVTGQEIIVYADDKQVARYNYDLASSMPDGTGVITNYLKSGYNIGMQLEYIDSYDPDIMLPINGFRVKYDTSTEYNLNFRGAKSLDNHLKLESFQNNTAVLVQPQKYKIEVNYNSYICVLYIWDSTEEKWGPAQDTDEVFSDKYSFTLTASDIRTIQAVLLGTYNPSDMKIISITPSAIKAEVNGEEISIDISSRGLFNKNVKSDVQFCYTKVNSPVLEDIPFANLESEKEFQFLKQQWDTTNETENFWWINKDNVLVLTKSHFILRRKASAISNYAGVLIDDWNGDTFVDVGKWRRFDYLPSTVLKYLCSCAYGGDSAKLITLSVSGSTLTIHIYDPLKDMQDQEYSIQFMKRELGTALNISSDKIYTYSDLDYESAVSSAQISATCIDGNILIGLHIDNNFNQWALIISTFIHVIQGYGYVGLNGSLTGGEIPAKYFSIQAGFTGVVQPLSKLSDRSYNISRLEELYQLTDMIVGTDSQQWYISKNIPSIVSHIEYNRGIFSVREIKLNNNYAVKYASSSYKAVNFSNYKLNVKDMKDILPDSNSVWNAALSFMLRPQLYFLEPKITIANYLQQTLGQAAYVHYNSTSVSRTKDPAEDSTAKNFSAESALEQSKESLQKAAILSDEISFDRQSVKQTQDTKSPYNTVFTLFAAALVSALDWGQDKLQVNKNQNQSATSDTGNKYSQMFLQNVNSMAASDMLINALNPSETSEVTALKTLDMFYSTSDKQEINAGPGYTEHNFVAMCVTQSVTSMQAEFLQQRMMYLISALTFYQIKITNKTAEIAAEAAKVMVDALGGSGFFIGGLANGGTVSTVAALAAQAAYLAAITAKNATDIALDLLPPVLEALGGGRLQSTVTMHLPKHNYDVEGKHKYGAKSECFRWPCFGISSAQSIVDESVEVITQNKAWALNTDVGSPVKQMDSGQPSFVTDSVPSSLQKNFVGQVPYHIAMVKGKQTKITLPADMSYVIGAESILPANDFKNQNIGLPEPSFNKPNLHDYMIDKTWQLSVAAGGGYQMWVSCKDTKLIDGAFSNIVVNNQFCGVASPYTAIEVKTGIQKQYLRPWAITSNVIALNNSGLNCCFEEKAYHAFDGYSQRIINWLGSPGLNKEFFVRLHSFFINDRFKRSNMIAASHYTGNFHSEPSMAMPGDMTNKLYVNFDTTDTESSRNSIERAAIGEVLGIVRIAVPVFSEFVNTLPAAVKTIDSVPLAVVQGITGLVSNVRDLQCAYKMPVSVDFTIGKTVYRYTQEYICEVRKSVTSGVVDLQDIVPCLGLDFIGATPYEAYLYSHNTKQYYVFNGGSSLQLVDMIERFRDILHGRYDFVNQEVLVPCVATFLRLDKNVADDNDETDNVIVPRLKGNDFIGEVSPPLDTIFNTRSGFRTVSLPCGITYQGPNRCIINRFCFQDYMLQQVKDNYGKWKRVPREKYHPFRTYKDKYSQVDTSVESNVRGWTHNPFLLVTAPLGISENVDCVFEWEITFCWPVEMDKLYSPENYAVVNIQAECMTPGGKVIADRPVHVFLKKDLFTRTGNYGYYSFRYQGKCGAGNRERLHIWSDQYICLSSLQCEYKPMTEKRTEILTIQADVQGMDEI